MKKVVFQSEQSHFKGFTAALLKTIMTRLGRFGNPRILSLWEAITQELEKKMYRAYKKDQKSRISRTSSSVQSTTSISTELTAGTLASGKSIKALASANRNVRASDLIDKEDFSSYAPSPRSSGSSSPNVYSPRKELATPKTPGTPEKL